MKNFSTSIKLTIVAMLAVSIQAKAARPDPQLVAQCNQQSQERGILNGDRARSCQKRPAYTMCLDSAAGTRNPSSFSQDEIKQISKTCMSQNEGTGNKVVDMFHKQDAQAEQERQQPEQHLNSYGQPESNFDRVRREAIEKGRTGEGAPQLKSNKNGVIRF